MDTTTTNQVCRLDPAQIGQTGADCHNGINNCLDQPDFEAKDSCVDRYLLGARPKFEANIACRAADPELASLWHEGADAVSWLRDQMAQSVGELGRFSFCSSRVTYRVRETGAALCRDDLVKAQPQEAACKEILQDTQAIAQECKLVMDDFNNSLAQLEVLVRDYQVCGLSTAEQQGASSSQERQEFEVLVAFLHPFVAQIGDERFVEWCSEGRTPLADPYGLGFLILQNASGLHSRHPYGTSGFAVDQDTGALKPVCGFPYALEDSVASPEMAAN